MADIIGHMPSGRRKSPKGWETFSGPCCIHNNETPDRRGRAGIKISDDIIAYSCFNCHYKAHFIPGRQLNRGMRNLLDWLGTDDNEIKRLSFESFRLKEEVGDIADFHVEQFKADFKDVDIPGNVVPLHDPDKIAYLEDRGFRANDYPFLETDETKHRLNQRIIIPFTYDGKLVGYTGRLAKDTQNNQMRYWLQKQSGYVFNVDNQGDKETILLHEGPMDAIVTGGIAVMGGTIEPSQIDVIESLNKKVVVVPDREATGQGLIDEALKNHWGVAFPDWEDDVTDAGEAYRRYGKIYTLQSILTSVETYSLKIDVYRKKFA